MRSTEVEPQTEFVADIHDVDSISIPPSKPLIIDSTTLKSFLSTTAWVLPLNVTPPCDPYTQYCREVATFLTLGEG